MINDEEIQISNKSYINKDFASIYPELLDLTKKLTAKWDPETSNESDPGVVLLKLMAFMGDKLNYNVDKNVLECFMPSATQESSMRKLCDMLGYEMGYYNAAEVDVNISYKGDDEISLDALTTVFTSKDSDDVPYVLVQNTTVSNANTITVPALQGNLRALYILDSTNTLISLDNIDDDNRLYFPVVEVAQNGVFITNDGGDGTFWDRVRNLNTVVPGRHVFKFGYDSSRHLPYVEFPEDIANIIGSGLRVSYIVTKGVDGNVKAKYLQKISAASGLTEQQRENLSVVNVYASFGGANPQNVDEAYNGFKKTIGTFDTLVSCRDYANYIYNMEDGLGSPKVSNVQVSDRRDDINYGTKVLTFSDGCVHYVNVKSDDIDANDLCLYPLKPYLSTNMASFVESFRPLNFTDYPKTITQDAEFGDVKTVSHDYKILEGNDIYLIKNYAKLNARIATINKVNDVEQEEILNNVYRALADNFNARKVDYGYEIPYDTIVSVMENADARISSVGLLEPELRPVIMTRSPTNEKQEFDLDASGAQDAYNKILAHNIVQGKIPMYAWDDTFDYELGQTAGERITKVKQLTTAVDISLSSNYYSLKKNEAIQLIAPNIQTDITYRYGVKVWFSGTPTFNADTYFELQNGMGMTVDYFVNSGTGEHVSVNYGEGDIIKFSTNVVNGVPQGWSESGGVYTIPSNGSVVIGKLSEVSLTKTTHCFWQKNNADNRLFENTYVTGTAPNEVTHYYTILGDGERFFYANDDYTEMVVLESGTIIETTLNQSFNGYESTEPWTLGPDSKLSTSEMYETSVSEISGRFVDATFSEDKPLSVLETTIVTLMEGDSICADTSVVLYDSSTHKNPIVDIQNAEITYKLLGEDAGVEHTFSSELNSHKSYIRARLDVDAGKDFSQKLLTNQYIDVLYVLYVDANNEEHTATKSFGANYLFNISETCQTAGGEIDMSVYNYTKSEFEYPVSFYAFTMGDNTVARSVRGLASYSFSSSNTPIEYDLPKVDDWCDLMIYWESSDDTKLKVYSTNGTVYNIEDLSTSISTPSSIGSVDSGKMIVLALDNVAEDIIFEPVSATTGNLTIGKIRYCEADGSNQKLNEAFGLGTSDADALISAVAGISGGEFYYTASLDNDRAIDLTGLEDGMKSPYAFFDINNAANKFTIEEIDFEHSDIQIMRSSRL